MRKIIITSISLILLGLGIFFLIKFTKSYTPATITENGELTFEYSKIVSLERPESEHKIITTLDELKKIVTNHNFNTKHSYIYIRLDSDNKHNYSLTNVTKTPVGVICTVTKTPVSENITVELTETTTEYMIDINGILDKSTDVMINLVE